LPSTAALSFASSTLNRPRDSVMKKLDHQHGILFEFATMMHLCRESSTKMDSCVSGHGNRNPT
jgi:hypothetical protein